jgi:hypothetical protein
MRAENSRTSFKKILSDRILLLSIYFFVIGIDVYGKSSPFYEDFTNLHLRQYMYIVQTLHKSYIEVEAKSEQNLRI